jgi:hypothetical protein
MARPRNITPNLKMVLRGGRFYARWWANNTWQRKSLNTGDRELAEDRFREMAGTMPVPAVALAAWDRSRRPSHRGLISETKVILRLLELGAEVYVAWGHDHRADLIVVAGSRVARVQVKSARARGANDNLFVGARFLIYGKPQGSLTQEHCDVIIAYSPAKDDCFVIAVDGRGEYALNKSSRLRDLSQVFGEMVLPERIELSTSALPKQCSTTELQQPLDATGTG